MFFVIISSMLYSIIMLFSSKHHTMSLTVCSNGTYGENCVSTCGNCVNDTICDSVTGNCDQGCTDGYVEPLCASSKIYPNLNWRILHALKL